VIAGTMEAASTMRRQGQDPQQMQSRELFDKAVSIARQTALTRDEMATIQNNRDIPPTESTGHQRKAVRFAEAAMNAVDTNSTDAFVAARTEAHPAPANADRAPSASLRGKASAQNGDAAEM